MIETAIALYHVALRTTCNLNSPPPATHSSNICDTPRTVGEGGAHKRSCLTISAEIGYIRSKFDVSSDGVIVLSTPAHNRFPRVPASASVSATVKEELLSLNRSLDRRTSTVSSLERSLYCLFKSTYHGLCTLSILPAGGHKETVTRRPLKQPAFVLPAELGLLASSSADKCTLVHSRPGKHSSEESGFPTGGGALANGRGY